MTYTTIDQTNVTDLGDLFTYSASVVPIFPMLILIAVWLIAGLGTFFASRRDVGFGDMPASFTVASFVTSIVAIIMSMIGGLITVPVLVIPIALTIIGFMWLVFSKTNV